MKPYILLTILCFILMSMDMSAQQILTNEPLLKTDNKIPVRWSGHKPGDKPHPLQNITLLPEKAGKVSFVFPDVINTENRDYPAFYQPRIYSRDDFMKLPASNINDIIQILDRDRILTEW